MELCSMDNQKIANEWFEIAQTDLDSAEFLLQMHPLPAEIVCFHCQQAAEKFLKGFLALQNEKIQRTHDLMVLLRNCSQHDAGFDSLENECLTLTDYSVAIRYPSPIDITDDDAKKAINHAKRIQEILFSILEKK